MKAIDDQSKHVVQHRMKALNCDWSKSRDMACNRITACCASEMLNVWVHIGDLWSAADRLISDPITHFPGWYWSHCSWCSETFYNTHAMKEFFIQVFLHEAVTCVWKWQIKFPVLTDINLNLNCLHLCRCLLVMANKCQYYTWPIQCAAAMSINLRRQTAEDRRPLSLTTALLNYYIRRKFDYNRLDMN